MLMIELDGLFMASVVAILVADYWVLTKGNIFIAHCYDGSRLNKHYYYTRGWNLQAVIAYLCGIALPFPGFVGSLGANVSTAATNLGHLGWLLSFATSFIIYCAICQVWPTQNQKMVKQMSLAWEEMADRDIVALDGTAIPESLEGRSDGEAAVVYESFDEKAATIN